MQTFRLFVSSPGDVMVERRRVENVASRLNGEFAGVARLEVIRWETKNYQAFSTFQAQIPRSIDCDLVIGILKWRLGTELPPDFAEKLPDGQSFPSGTAYEILTAIEKRQKGLELPDVYVFRFAGSSPTVAIEDPDREKIEHDWQVLKEFFQGWFLTAQGHFKAAFNSYASEDDLEAHLEKLLRNWMAEKVAGGRAVRWPIAVKGSPFCGLAAFGAKHAPVFFGRGHDIARAVDLWRDAGHTNAPYLLVIGASGSGKSSLARAGLVPRLTTPGVIKEVDVWRVAVMRPSDSPRGPFEALAAAVMQSEAGLAKEEQGRGAALPEIALGDSRTPADLASVLSHVNPATAIKPIINALDYVAKAEHDRGNYTREVRCDLVLLIDQLDELFAASVSDADRDAFLDLVAAMVATSRIWIVTTLRADLYPRMLGQPALKKLKELGATYDLAPPGSVELAEIVRSPAEAAGLVYETDAANGERLDDRLLRDAEQPDMLPLVQLALSRLFEGREQVGGELRLPLAVYESLGGLKGIINEAGERAIASVGEAEQARLPRLLRQLAVPARDQSFTVSDALTVRAVPLAEAAPDQATRTLLDALVTARLLTVSGNEVESASKSADGADKNGDQKVSLAPTEAQVRLTHQRVLEDWNRACTIVAESADFYRVRSDLEENYRRWNNGGRRSELLLARGLPLAEAENLVGKYGDELTPAVRDYVKASRKRANRAQVIGWSAAAVFALVAIGAGIEWKTASEQRAAAEVARQEAQAERDRATRALTLATRTANGLVFDLAQKFRDVLGVPAATIKDILDRARQLQDQLLGSGEADPALRRSQAVALDETASTLLTLGDTQGALTLTTRAHEIFQSLLAQQPDSIDAQRELSVSYQKVGDVQVVQGHLPEALASYQADLAIIDRFAKSNPSSALWHRSLSVCHEKVGNVQVAQGHLPEALASYQASFAIRDQLVQSDPGNAGWQRDLSVSYSKIGGVQAAQGHLPEALTSYQADLAIAERLAKSDPGNADWQRDLLLAYGPVGDVQVAQGHLPEAMTSYQMSLAIADRLAKSDPGNADWQRDLSVAYNNAGDVLVAQGHLQDGLASYQASLAIRERLAKSDPGNAGRQSDLSEAYNKIGQAQVNQGHLPEAMTSYQAAFAITDRLTKSDPGNTNWQNDVAGSYDRIGNVQTAQGHLPEAMTSYQAAFAITDRLAKSDPGNAGWQVDLSVSFERIGNMQLAQGHLPEALASYQPSLAIRERLANSDPGNADWQRGLSVAYEKVGDIRVMQGHLLEALTSYQADRAITDRLAKSDPGNAGWQRDSAVSHERVGNVQMAQGHLPEALASYHASFAIRDRLAKSEPGNAGWQRDLSIAYNKIGDVQVAQGHLPDALTSYQARLAIANRLAKSDPGNADWQRDLSFSYQNVGDVQMAQGHLPEALTSYQADLALADRLAKFDPDNAGWQRDLSFSYEKVGNVQVAQGHLPEALATYQADLALADRLAKSDPGNAGWQRDLSISYNRIGDVQMAQHQLPEALTSYDAAVSIRERLAKSDPGNADWQRDLSLVYEKVGDVQVAQGHLPQALTSYQADIAITDRLAASDAGNTGWQRDLSIGHGRVGDVQKALGHLPETLAAYQAAFTIADRLAKSDPGNPGWQRDLSVAYEKVGNVQMAQGHLPEALTSYQADLDISDRLAKSDPSNAVWQRDVEITVEKLGGLSYEFLLGAEFSKALETSDLAISHAPDKIWLYTNRAHALTFLDHTQEARELYLQYRGEKDVQDGKPWTALILEDFAALRKAGLSRPLMEEIEKQFM